MADIERAVAARSRRSLFRDLTALGYLSSYTHTGRYYTLRSVPDFDADGLWRYQGIGFSRDGTLKATVWRLVDTSAAGRTHRELQRRLGVRVHNPLLELVESQQLGRAPLEGEYVYVAAARRRSERQLKCRRALVAAGSPPTAPPAPTLAVEVLLEIIHGTVVRLDAQEVAARLVARGVAATAAQVAELFRRHGIGKKRCGLALRARGVEAAGRSLAGHGAAPGALDRRHARVRRRAAGTVPGLRRRHGRAEDDPAPRHHAGAWAVPGLRDCARLRGGLPQGRGAGHAPRGDPRGSPAARGATVNVTFGPSACVPVTPTVALGPSTGTWIPPGATATYTVSIANNDGAACAPARFDLGPAVPSGWAAVLDDPSVTLAPGATAATTLQLTSAPAALPGTYVLLVTATRAADGTSTSTAASCVIVASFTATVSTDRATYSRNQTATITTVVTADGAPVAGASVALAITKPDGSVVRQSLITGASGAAVGTMRLKGKAGTYRVTADANVPPALRATASTTFTAR